MFSILRLGQSLIKRNTTNVYANTLKFYSEEVRNSFAFIYVLLLFIYLFANIFCHLLSTLLTIITRKENNNNILHKLNSRLFSQNTLKVSQISPKGCSQFYI